MRRLGAEEQVILAVDRQAQLDLRIGLELLQDPPGFLLLDGKLDQRLDIGLARIAAEPVMISSRSSRAIRSCTVERATFSLAAIVVVDCRALACNSRTIRRSRSSLNQFVGVFVIPSAFLRLSGNLYNFRQTVNEAKKSVMDGAAVPRRQWPRRLRS